MRIFYGFSGKAITLKNTTITKAIKCNDDRTKLYFSIINQINIIISNVKTVIS